MSDSAVSYALERGVVTLTLNQPERKNTLGADLVNALGDGIQQAGQDSAARVIVLTNVGNTFCAGADLKGGGTTQPRYSLVELFQLMQRCPKPIVGRIAGHCMGGGVGLAAACDLSVAADDILFGFTEVRIGVAPAIISVVCLPKLRRADAMELFLGGERISATRAAQVGLINRALPIDNVDAEVSALVDRLVRGGPQALAASKQLVMQVADLPVEEAFAHTQVVSETLFQSEEAAQGIAAFRAKEDAPWIPGD